MRGAEIDPYLGWSEAGKFGRKLARLPQVSLYALLPASQATFQPVEDPPLSKVEKGPYGRSSKKPTVGRHDDLQWVASATYRRSLLGV